MSKHTPEPWPPFIDVCEPATPHPYSNEIVCLGFDDYRRARACVNACRGIGTDELEQHGLVSLLATQREELLAALQRLISSDPHVEMFPTSELEICANNEALTPTLREQAASVIQARAVIAMVKGGAVNHLPDTAKMVPDGCAVLMTLDEAIDHANEKSIGSSQCAAQHAQLAKWLTDYRAMLAAAPKHEGGAS